MSPIRGGMAHLPSKTGGPLWRGVSNAIARAEAFLVAAQDGDGFWRDYVLPPGASEAWVTAVVLYALETRPNPGSPPPRQLELGLSALSHCFSSGGWGYNRVTPPDADSTAWSVLAASRTRNASLGRLRACLSSFIDDEGLARTYRGLVDRPGWQAGHADVTPVVGLALGAAGADRGLLDRVRAALLRARVPGGSWSCYWWTTPSYAAAWALRFLRSTGGVPEGVAREVNGAIRQLGDAQNDFDRSHRILTSIHGGCPIDLMLDLDALLENQLGDGAWSPSNVLRLPSGMQLVAHAPRGSSASDEGLETPATGSATPATGSATPATGSTVPATGSTAPAAGDAETEDAAYGRTYADCRGIMTSAMATLALKDLLRSVEQGLFTR